MAYRELGMWEILEVPSRVHRGERRWAIQRVTSQRCTTIRRIGRWAGKDRVSCLPVTGSDLTEIGLFIPAVGRALLRIRTAYLDGALCTHEEALALALELSRGRGARRLRRPKTQP